MTHILKILKPFADAITSGEKSFEVRRNDRNFQKGDLVEFYAVSETSGEPAAHPINAKQYRIGYVLKFEDFPAGLSEGFAVFTINDEQKDEYKRGFEEAARCCADIVDAEAWAYCDNAIRRYNEGDKREYTASEGASHLASNIRERILEELLKEGEE